jgi:hypothetical protein
MLTVELVAVRHRAGSGSIVATAGDNINVNLIAAAFDLPGREGHRSARISAAGVLGEDSHQP